MSVRARGSPPVKSVCENAELNGFAEKARPGFGGEFGVAAGEFDGIRAIDAAERATVREFGD